MSRSCVAEIRANATEEAKGQDRRVAASAGHVSKQQRGHVGKRARMRRRQAVEEGDKDVGNKDGMANRHAAIILRRRRNTRS